MSTPAVAIVGATGQTGKWALKGAVERGYLTRVLARDASKVDRIVEELGISRDRLTVVTGSVTDPKKLIELFTGTHVVLSFLGMTPEQAKKKQPIVRPGVEAMTEAMKALECPPKLISMSSIGLNNGEPHGRQAWGCCLLSFTRDMMLKFCFADLKAAELQLESAREDGLTITIARATILADKKGYLKDFATRQPDYVLLAHDLKGKMSFQIDRQHVAEAFLDMCLTADRDNCNVSIFSK
jgi:nucleoside-diphosphate-sugar epimerase